MYFKFYVTVFVLYWKCVFKSIADDESKIELIDLTRPANWKELAEYYNAIEKRWKICVNCGAPGLGTAMHLEHSPSVGAMRPALIPSEYLLTRMAIVDVSGHSLDKANYVLTLDVARQWPILKHDPREPTLLVFKFGWAGYTSVARVRSCVCTTPGISYELAEWIATNLTHVMGVATDAPTLESAKTREFSSRTVTNLLGRSGVYMIENVHIRKKIPEHGCMSFAMPMKILNFNFVPIRLTAFCPTTKTNQDVVVALRNFKEGYKHVTTKSRIYDVNMEDLLQFEE